MRLCGPYDIVGLVASWGGGSQRQHERGSIESRGHPWSVVAVSTGSALTPAAGLTAVACMPATLCGLVPASHAVPLSCCSGGWSRPDRCNLLYPGTMRARRSVARSVSALPPDYLHSQAHERLAAPLGEPTCSSHPAPIWHQVCVLLRRVDTLSARPGRDQQVPAAAGRGSTSWDCIRARAAARMQEGRRHQSPAQPQRTHHGARSP
jgi:hypothetical protein